VRTYSNPDELSNSVFPATTRMDSAVTADDRSSMSLMTKARNVSCEKVTTDPDGMARRCTRSSNNAINFSRSVPEPHIEIGGKYREQSCRIGVRDHDVGFDMKYHDRIFEILQYLHPMEDHSGTDGRPGMGRDRPVPGRRILPGSSELRPHPARRVRFRRSI